MIYQIQVSWNVEMYSDTNLEVTAVCIEGNDKNGEEGVEVVVEEGEDEVCKYFCARRKELMTIVLRSE